jgi:hypothetical protein
MSGVMAGEDLVDAALVGLDPKETVTIPSVPDAAAWEASEQTRKILASAFGNSEAAERYCT